MANNRLRKHGILLAFGVLGVTSPPLKFIVSWWQLLVLIYCGYSIQ